jgi:hypothetical protein
MGEPRRQVVCEEDLVHAVVLCHHDASRGLHEADEAIAVPFVVIDVDAHESASILPNAASRPPKPSRLALQAMRASRKDAMAVSNAQLAQRQNLFRDANERIEYAAAVVGHKGLRPFICECSLDGCVERIEVETAVYETVRDHSARFLTLPGHEIAEIEDVVGRGEGYQVVEKQSVFAEIAMSGNPRR